MATGGNLLYYGTFFGYVVFLVLFIRSRFWRSQMGWHVFAFMLILAILFGLGILRRIIGSEWFEAHRVALTFWSFLATFVVAWWRVVLLAVAQNFNPGSMATTVVEDHERVIVEGENQRVTIQGDDTDPDVLGNKEPARD